MELSNGVRCIGQIPCWLPGVLSFSVAFPSYQILELPSIISGVEDDIYFVFLFSVNYNRLRGWGKGSINVIPSIRQESVNVEHRMEL